MTEQIPFEGNEDEGFDGDAIELSPAVEAIVTGEAFADLSVDELIELAQCAIGEAVGALIVPLSEDEAIEQSAVIAATQLECAATILASVFEDEDEGDEEGEEDEPAPF
jgi:hypothetical protein